MDVGLIGCLFASIHLEVFKVSQNIIFKVFTLLCLFLLESELLQNIHTRRIYLTFFEVLRSSSIRLSMLLLLLQKLVLLLDFCYYGVTCKLKTGVAEAIRIIKSTEGGVPFEE